MRTVAELQEIVDRLKESDGPLLIPGWVQADDLLVIDQITKTANWTTIKDGRYSVTTSFLDNNRSFADEARRVAPGQLPYSSFYNKYNGEHSLSYHSDSSSFDEMRGNYRKEQPAIRSVTGVEGHGWLYTINVGHGERHPFELTPQLAEASYLATPWLLTPGDTLFWTNWMEYKGLRHGGNKLGKRTSFVVRWNHQ